MSVNFFFLKNIIPDHPVFIQSWEIYWTNAFNWSSERTEANLQQTFLFDKIHNPLQKRWINCYQAGCWLLDFLKYRFCNIDFLYTYTVLERTLEHQTLKKKHQADSAFINRLTNEDTGGLDPIISSGPFQPLQFWDSVTTRHGDWEAFILTQNILTKKIILVINNPMSTRQTTTIFQFTP